MIRITKDVQEFLNELKSFNVADNSFMSYEYYRVFSEYNRPRGFFCLLVYDRENTLKGILPLQKHGLSYSIYGHKASNYLGYICRDEDVEFVDSEIVHYFMTKDKNAIITYYDINNATALYDILSEDTKAINIPLYICPYVDVEQDFEKLFEEKITPSKKRTELRKFRRKLDLVGEVRFVNIVDHSTFKENKKYIPQIYQIHRERFSDVYIPTEFCLHQNQKYYTDLLESLADGNRVLLSMLLIDEVVVSFLYTLISDGIVMDWMPAFDPAFSKYSLGTVHLMMLVQYLCGSPAYKALDFSKGGGLYKDRWATDLTENHMFVRTFHSSLVSNIKQKCLVYPYKVKSYFRNKGILRIIKQKLGRINGLSSRRSKEGFESKRLSDPQIINHDLLESEGLTKDKFGYSTLRSYSTEFRKSVLDAIYQGKKIDIYKRNNEVVYVSIT